MRGDRQRFCPACSGAASSQRPLTGSDTSLRCRRECVCAGAWPAVLQPAWFKCPCNFYSTSQQFIHSSSPARHVYLVYFASWCIGKHICVCGEDEVGGEKRPHHVFGSSVEAQGHSLRVFGLRLKFPCTDRE